MYNSVSINLIINISIMSKSRTLSICLSDLPKDRILKHSNGKMYLNLTTYDHDEPDQFGNHFSVSLPLTENQIKKKESGEKVQRIFLGNGKIWGNSTRQITQEESDDLPF
jgi:hypothetical protein|tara:strand:- start:308 stop:637 length:330 start_codon:yes stop_codon:yes gene_type:complete